MKCRTIILVAALVCAVSCSPEPDIPFDDMVNIHHDMLIVEASLSDIPDLYVRRGYEHVDLPVIEKYGYTQKQYLAAVKYYLYDTKQFIAIMDAVKARLQEDEKMLSEAGKGNKQFDVDTAVSIRKVGPGKRGRSVRQPGLLIDSAKSSDKVPARGERKLTLKDLEEMEKKLK